MVNSITVLTLINTILSGGFQVCDARKNVLFIVGDDLRPQLGSYAGNDFPSKVHPPMYTPNLDKLAAKSLLLKRAYVQQALCSPSRASFLTGRRPDTTHVYNLDSYFREVGGDFTTIPQYFKNKGYVSTGMGKIFHPGSASGGHDDKISWTERYYHAHSTWENEHNRTSWRAIPDHQLINKPLQDEQVANFAISKLRHLAPGAKSGHRPFFAAVGFHRPHLPFMFPSSILRHYPAHSIHLPDNEYAPINMPRVAWSGSQELISYNDIKSLHNYVGAINTTLPHNVTKALRRAYYSSVTWMDSLVGRVLDELETLGLADNTIVSFLGDHGWQLGEHGEWCKHTNFEIATHAPMMIHIPGLTDSGIVTEKLTEMVDLFPTLVEAAGFSPLPLCPHNSSSVSLCREGESLMPLIQNPNAPWKNASFSQYPRSSHHHTKTIMGYTVRSDRYRYTEWVSFSNTEHKPNWHDVHDVEFYDHQVDPDENNNIASVHSHAKRTHQIQLRKGWRTSLPVVSNPSSLFG